MKIVVSDMNKVAVGWVINYAKQNIYKFEQFYELEDLIQDGLIIVLKCREKYGTDISPSHFMSLVKSSFKNYIVSLLRKKKHRYDNREDIMYLLLTGSKLVPSIIDPATQNTIVKIKEMPDMFKKVFALFQSEEGLRALRRPYRNFFDREEETEQVRLHELTGWLLELDFFESFREFLYSES